MSMPNLSQRERFASVAPGDPPLSFPTQPGEDILDLRRRLCLAAHRAWGKGSYRTAMVGDTVRISRIDPERPEPPKLVRLPAMAASEAERLLSRQEAAEWLSPYFPGGGITAVQLQRHAGKGTGPRYLRNGRTPIYRTADLVDWLSQRLRPADQAA